MPILRENTVPYYSRQQSQRRHRQQQYQHHQQQQRYSSSKMQHRSEYGHYISAVSTEKVAYIIGKANTTSATSTDHPVVSKGSAVDYLQQLQQHQQQQRNASTNFIAVPEKENYNAADNHHQPFDRAALEGYLIDGENVYNNGYIATGGGVFSVAATTTTTTTSMYNTLGINYDATNGKGYDTESTVGGMLDLFDENAKTTPTVAASICLPAPATPTSAAVASIINYNERDPPSSFHVPLPLQPLPSTASPSSRLSPPPPSSSLSATSSSEMEKIKTYDGMAEALSEPQDDEDNNDDVDLHDSFTPVTTGTIIDNNAATIVAANVSTDNDAAMASSSPVPAAATAITATANEMVDTFAEDMETAVEFYITTELSQGCAVPALSSPPSSSSSAILPSGKTQQRRLPAAAFINNSSSAYLIRRRMSSAPKKDIRIGDYVKNNDDEDEDDDDEKDGEEIVERKTDDDDAESKNWPLESASSSPSSLVRNENNNNNEDDYKEDEEEDDETYKPSNEEDGDEDDEDEEGDADDDDNTDNNDKEASTSGICCGNNNNGKQIVRATITADEDLELLKTIPLVSNHEYVYMQTRKINAKLSDKHNMALNVARKAISNCPLNELEQKYASEIEYAIENSSFADIITKDSLKCCDNVSFYKKWTPLETPKLFKGGKSHMDAATSHHIDIEPPLKDRLCEAEQTIENIVHFKEYISDHKISRIHVLMNRSKFNCDDADDHLRDCSNAAKPIGPINVQNLIVHVQRHYCKENRFIIDISDTEDDVDDRGVAKTSKEKPQCKLLHVDEYFMIYRSSRLLAALEVIERQIKTVFHSRTNSKSDFTSYSYNMEYIEAEQYAVLESFLCFVLQHRDTNMRKNKKSKVHFDFYEGEWSLILYIYWELCTQDLLTYNEHVLRHDEKRLLGFLMYQIYKSVRSERESFRRRFKLHILNNAFHKLQLSNVRFIPMVYLEYIKHYLSLFTTDVAPQHQSLWNMLFKRLGVHHHSCLHTFEAVMARRKAILLQTLKIFADYNHLANDEYAVDMTRYAKPWQRCGNFAYFSALTGETIELTKLRSQLFRLTGKHITKPQINYLLGSVFADANDIADRLQYEIETMYQLFVDLLAEYTVNADIHERLTDENTREFFCTKLEPLRRKYRCINCVTSIGVPHSINVLMRRSFEKVLSSKRGEADTNFDDDVLMLLRFYTVVNESLSYACAPLITQYDKNSLNSYEWNTQLCCCFDEFRTMVFENFDFIQLPTWYVSSSPIDVDYKPEYLRAFGSSEKLWRIVNVLGVADDEEHNKLCEDVLKRANCENADNAKNDADFMADIMCTDGHFLSRVKRIMPLVEPNAAVRDTCLSPTMGACDARIYAQEHSNIFSDDDLSDEDSCDDDAQSLFSSDCYVSTCDEQNNEEVEEEDDDDERGEEESEWEVERKRVHRIIDNASSNGLRNCDVVMGGKPKDCVVEASINATPISTFGRYSEKYDDFIQRSRYIQSLEESAQRAIFPKKYNVNSKAYRSLDYDDAIITDTDEENERKGKADTLEVRRRERCHRKFKPSRIITRRDSSLSSSSDASSRDASPQKPSSPASTVTNASIVKSKRSKKTVRSLSSLSSSSSSSSSSSNSSSSDGEEKTTRHRVEKTQRRTSSPPPLLPIVTSQLSTTTSSSLLPAKQVSLAATNTKQLSTSLSKSSQQLSNVAAKKQHSTSSQLPKTSLKRENVAVVGSDVAVTTTINNKRDDIDASDTDIDEYQRTQLKTYKKKLALRGKRKQSKLIEPQQQQKPCKIQSTSSKSVALVTPSSSWPTPSPPSSLKRPVVPLTRNKTPRKRRLTVPKNFFSDSSYARFIDAIDEKRVSTLLRRNIQHPSQLGFQLDHRRGTVREYAIKHNIIRAFDERILEERLDTKYQNTNRCLALLSSYSLPDDYFTNSNYHTGKEEPYRWYAVWSRLKSPQPSSTTVKIFTLISNDGLEKGKRARKCVLCPDETVTTYNIVITKDCVVSACLYCTHQLNLSIIHGRYTYDELRSELRRRVNFRYKAPLCFDDQHHYKPTLPNRTSIRDVYTQTYNKKHEKYGLRLKIHGDEIIARMASSEGWLKNNKTDKVSFSKNSTSSSSRKRKNKTCQQQHETMKKPKSKEFIDNEEDHSSS